MGLSFRFSVVMSLNSANLWVLAVAKSTAGLFEVGLTLS